MNVYKRATALEKYTFVLAHQASIQGILQIVKNSVTYSAAVMEE